MFIHIYLCTKKTICFVNTKYFSSFLRKIAKKVGKGILFRLERGGAPQKGGTDGYRSAVMV